MSETKYRIKAIRNYHIDAAEADLYGVPVEERDGEEEVTLELTVGEDGKIISLRVKKWFGE